MLQSLSCRSPLCRPPSHFLSSTPVPSRRSLEFRLPRNPDPYLPPRILCCSGKKSRKDLANIVRRRGYKAITELLLNSTGENHSIPDKNLDPRDADSIASTGGDGQLFQEMASEALEEDNPNEVNRLKRLLEQKKKELSQLKQQIEYEKLALRNLQARAKAELGDIQRSTAKKDEELRAFEECLNGLKEVHIDYWANGQIIELAGSFNGWQHRIKMNLHPSSEHTNSLEARKLFRWTTVLWLYPGVYEIKFIVDGDWRIDSQREIITSGGITNNVLRVDG